jgi:hypothetical protein
MTTHELIFIFLQLQHHLAPYNPIIELVNDVTKQLSNTYENIAALTSTNTPDTRAAQIAQLNKNMDVIREKALERPLPNIFISINELQTSLNSINDRLNVPSGKSLVLLREGIQDFQDQFEKVIKRNAKVNLIEFALSAYALSTTIEAIHEWAGTMVEILSHQNEVRSEEDSLSIQFSSSDTLTNIVDKLAAINEIYTELCVLFDESAAQFPLRVVRIESGTWWGVLIGRGRVIKLVGELIKSAISYVHRNYTTEGLIEGIPREIEVADRVLQFSQKLRDAGIDDTVIQEQVQKATFSIASKLTRLVGSEASMEVNGEAFSVGQGVEQRFLHESKNLLLTEGDVPPESDAPNDAAQLLPPDV